MVVLLSCLVMFQIQPYPTFEADKKKLDTSHVTPISLTIPA